MSFPPQFVWGAAAAAYQVEGAAREDGKGPSVWDMFSHRPGKIHLDQNGDVASDHYHHWREDVALMKDLGLQAYRLSISWPRVLPSGVGEINPAGLAFYDRLVDELLAAEIVPYVTLFHWDYPQALYDRGSWLNPDAAEWFAAYAEQIVTRLGDRVRHWMTLNEPAVFVNLGYGDGTHAPGDRLGQAELLRIIHHVLLAHGRAVQAIRAASRTDCQVGIALSNGPAVPQTDSLQDIEAARKVMFEGAAGNLWNPTWWADPIVFGRYPDGVSEALGDQMPALRPGDLDTIRQPLDFLGLNIYSGRVYRAGASGEAEPLPFPPGHPITLFGWPIVPEALRWGPRFFWERYGLPIFLTENGLSNEDWIALDGGVHDPQRVDYTARYLRALHDAIQDGSDVRGYFHWSILDNFEWAEGFKQRFGLVHVDYTTQRRTPKDSAYWYRRVIESNGASLFE